MAWTSKQDREAVIELFTSGQVDEIVWEYQAGGDSLNEYTNNFYLKGEQVQPDIFDITDLILDNIDISEASDGHYLGEFGTVTVTLENDDLVGVKEIEEFLSKYNFLFRKDKRLSHFKFHFYLPEIRTVMARSGGAGN